MAKAEPYDDDWLTTETHSNGRDYGTASTTNATTVASSTSSYPSHSEFYQPQPSQLSEAEEIAKKNAEEKKHVC